MRRQRFVAARLRSGFKLAQESNDILRRDRVQVAEPGAEAKGCEPLQEARAVSDRELRQSALPEQLGLIFVAEALQRRGLFRRRLRDSRYTGCAEMLDEPSQAVLAPRANAFGNFLQRRLPKTLRSSAVQVAGAKSAFFNRRAKPVGAGQPYRTSLNCASNVRCEEMHNRIMPIFNTRVRALRRTPQRYAT